MARRSLLPATAEDRLPACHVGLEGQPPLAAPGKSFEVADIINEHSKFSDAEDPYIIIHSTHKDQNSKVRFEFGKPKKAK